jgi:hypothetical protein
MGCGRSFAAPSLGKTVPESRSTSSQITERESPSDTACPTSWTAAPTVDSALAVPDGGGGLLLHARGVGTQNYSCQAVVVDGGVTYAWVFIAPEANLDACPSHLAIHHFASDLGPSPPEWRTPDGTYVTGQKVHAVTPDGGAADVPWLLLKGVSRGGTGTLGKASYIQRVNTHGGVAPTEPCSATEHLGVIQKVSYGADYYFYGP